MKGSQVTIKDIAKALNISASTVSRALKDHPDISQETKKAVNDLAKNLDYEPNAIALSLRSQKTNTIGVIIPEIVHFFFSTVISGIEEVAYSAGYTVMICQSNESYDKEVIDAKALLAHRVDGLLVSFSKQTLNFDHFKEAQKKVPIVFFDRMTDQLEGSAVIVDDYYGAVTATQHLIDQKCTKIAHLAGPETLGISVERKKGYIDTLKKNKLKVTAEFIPECFKGTMDEGFMAMNKLLALPERPDAIFANNDMAAYGAMRAIKEAGLHIPNDIAIVGFSNWQFSALTDPQLTTISQPGVEIGRAAAKRLLMELNHKGEDIKPVTQVLKTDLLIRNSSQRF